MRTSSSDIELSVSEASDATIVFPRGLVGCEGWKRFVLLVDEEEELPVAVLRCLDDPDVALMVTDPALALASYDAPLSPEERSAIELGDGEEPQLYCTLSITNDGWLTANLVGPLAINPRTRTGKQVVLADSAYSTRHPITQMSGAVKAGAATAQCLS